MQIPIWHPLETAAFTQTRRRELTASTAPVHARAAHDRSDEANSPCSDYRFPRTIKSARFLAEKLRSAGARDAATTLR